METPPMKLLGVHLHWTPQEQAAEKSVWAPPSVALVCSLGNSV